MGILTLLRNVGILTLHNTILELLLRKVRIGTKWEFHFVSKLNILYGIVWSLLHDIFFCIKHMIIENSPIKYVFDCIMAPSRFSMNVKQKEHRIPPLLIAAIAIVSNPGVRLSVFYRGHWESSLNINNGQG